MGDLTWSQLSQLAWPGGHTVMMVADAISLTSPFVDCVTLDIKTYVDRWEEGEGGDVTRNMRTVRCAFN